MVTLGSGVSNPKLLVIVLLPLVDGCEKLMTMFVEEGSQEVVEWSFKVSTIVASSFIVGFCHWLMVARN